VVVFSYEFVIYGDIDVGGQMVARTLVVVGYYCINRFFFIDLHAPFERIIFKKSASFL